MKKNTTFIRTDDTVWIPIFSGNNTNDTVAHIPADFEYLLDLLEEEHKLDQNADMEQMVAFDLHQQKKHSRRYNRQKRRTSSRDKRGTLKAQVWEHSEKLYNRGERRNKLFKAHAREAKAVITGMELPVSITAIQMEPWNNDKLVLFVFDECAKRFVRDEHLSVREIFELETLRGYFELGKCRLAINPYFDEEFDNPTIENFFRLVIDHDACDLLSDVTYRIFMAKVAAKLYELHQREDYHLHYLKKLAVS